MRLPSIPEQLLEADRLCAESRRLLDELKALTAGAHERWWRIKLYNEERWGVRLPAGAGQAPRGKVRKIRPAKRP